MQLTFIFLANQAEQQALISIIIAYATVSGVIASILSVFFTFKKFKKDHEEKMATKDYVKEKVGNVELKVNMLDKKHDSTNEASTKRVDEIFGMVKFLYESEINKRNGN